MSTSAIAVNADFLHRHPYPPFIPTTADKLIVGTLPPPRFSQGLLKADDVDFCYGSRDGQLWLILGKIFAIDFLFENSQSAVEQRRDFLIKHRIGICDMVRQCRRQKIDASDSGMSQIILRPLLQYLAEYPMIKTLLFTGGNSKNSPEYLFRQHLKNAGLTLDLIDGNIPRIHQFDWQNRTFTTVSLTAPSGAANRAVGAMAEYKTLKKQNPAFNTIDFRVMQYRRFFI
ncbi:DNA glycosylase [Chelonobacter oris]|uniref:DNA glycosylase n=1 Tax=Chelonobacter oris TaxID=505317 RepID=A0A0A3AKL6_9PAST|nr:DNA glycosylase [Chelonobacter oris]